MTRVTSIVCHMSI